MNEEQQTYTQKRDTDALETAAETIVGLQRMHGNEVASVAAANVTSLRDQLIVVGAVAAADKAVETDCITASKKAAQDIDTFNDMAVGYGSIRVNPALTSVDTDGEGIDVAERLVVPALEAMHDPASKALAAFGSSLVKEYRSTEKAEARATAKAGASNAKWSDVYLVLTERVREGRALQTANGLDIPRRRKAPNKLKVDEPVEPPPVEAGTPAEVPVVTSTPTPDPAPQPVNSTTSAGTVSESGPPADPTKVAG